MYADTTTKAISVGRRGPPTEVPPPQQVLTLCSTDLEGRELTGLEHNLVVVAAVQPLVCKEDPLLSSTTMLDPNPVQHPVGLCSPGIVTHPNLG